MQGSDSFRLVVRRGPQPNQVYELNKDIVTLGRDITNDIVINDPEVSRHHMRLTRGAGGFTLEDLGSTNGTFVNGQRLTGARPLRGGDMVGLGETVTLAYEMAGAPAGMSAGGMEAPGSTVPGAASRPPAPSMAPTFSPPPPAQSPPPYGGSSYAPPSPLPQAQPYSAPAAPAYSQQPTYSSPAPVAPAPPQAPPGQGYDYDPYAVREEEQSHTTRWVLIGCAGLSLFCCCASVISLYVIDANCLWDKLPIIYQVIQAFGSGQRCTP